MKLKALLVPMAAGLALLAMACGGGDTFLTPDSSGQNGVSASWDRHRGWRTGCHGAQRGRISAA